jgi:hypothetical protein
MPEPPTPLETTTAFGVLASLIAVVGPGAVPRPGASVELEHPQA